MVVQNIAFGVIAAGMVIGALRVVTTRNVVHAALWLVIVLGGVAAQFVILAAEFVAVVQVLVYLGAIVVLLLFGVMLTRAPLGSSPRLTSEQWWVGAAVALVLLGSLVYVMVDAFGTEELARSTPTPTTSVADSLFSTYLVPFEVVSVLLLAALVGAVVLARRD